MHHAVGGVREYIGSRDGDERGKEGSEEVHLMLGRKLVCCLT
jgi:hypothetical protein